MKRSLFMTPTALLLLLAVTVSTAHAQKRNALDHLTIGASFSSGASMILDPPEGNKVSPILAYRITADMTYPLSPTISAVFGLGLDSRGTKLRNPDFSSIYQITDISYLAITPGFQFSAFHLGFHFGIPLSGTLTVKASPNSSEQSADIDTDNLAVLIEPRLGAVIPLVDEDVGWLGLTIMGGVSVNEILDRPEQAGIENPGIYNIAELQLGLTWQFAIESVEMP